MDAGMQIRGRRVPQFVRLLFQRRIHFTVNIVVSF